MFDLGLVYSQWYLLVAWGYIWGRGVGREGKNEGEFAVAVQSAVNCLVDWVERQWCLLGCDLEKYLQGDKRDGPAS